MANIRYLTGDEVKEHIVIDGVSAFLKGCFNCKNLEQRKSQVSGICPHSKVDVWKDWTCDLHNPIYVKINVKIF